MRYLFELREEALEALDKVWFLQSLEEIERTDISLSLRLHIRPQLFVQLFFGEKSGSLYMALIEGERRLLVLTGKWATGICTLSTLLQTMSR